MIRLETVEDFEKARTVLNNPKSKPHQYRIKEFGFCADCNEVTPFRHNADIEGVSVGCLRCGRGYYKLSGYRTVDLKYLTYLDIEMMPHWAKVSVNELHSRDSQRKFFSEALEEFIKTNKAGARKFNNIVRQAAKLRS